MKFEGTVGTSELPDIFQLLSSSGRIGALVVNQGRRQKRIFFTPDGLTLTFDTDQSNRLLGQILLARGVITEPQLVTALERQRASKMPIGEILVNLGATKSDAVQEALEYQLREEIFDLLTWEKATFQFEEDAAPPLGGRCFVKTPKFNTDAIVMEAARRADEWKRIRAVIPSGRVVPLRTEGVAEIPDDEGSTVREVLSLADGTCSIDEMRQILGRSEFDALEAAFTGIQAGLLRLADGRELATLANAALKAHDSERARQILAHAGNLAGMDLELRYDLGLLCLWAGAEKTAADHLDLVLGRLVEEDLRDKVAEMLDNVAEQFPDAPWSYERRLKTLNPEHDFEKALPLAKRLLEIYDRRRDVETATKMFRWLRRFSTHAPEQATRLAELLESRGDVAAAAQHYYLAARQFRFSSDVGAAIHLCEKAVKLNARHADARTCLAEMLSEPQRMRRRRVMQASAAAGGVLLLVLTLVQFSREWSAARAFALADAAATESLARGDYNAAASAYEQMARDYAGTTIGPVVVERRDKVETERTAFVASRVSTAASLRSKAQLAAAAGDFDAALALCGRLRMVGTSEDADAAKRLTDEMRREREAFDAKMRSACEFEASGHYAEALAACRAARDVSERLFRYDQVTLPIRVESRPAGAEVFVDGRPAGRTPTVVQRRADGDSEIRLHIDAYNDATTVVASASNDTVARMTLVPARRLLAAHALGDLPVGPPAILDAAAAYVTRSGRLIVWDTEDGHVLVDRKLDEQTTSFLAPIVVGGRWVVASLEGSVRAFDSSGCEIFRTPATGLLVANPTLVNGRIVLAQVGGKATFIDPVSGRVERTAKLNATALGEVHAAAGRLIFPAEGNAVQAYDPLADRGAWSFQVRAAVGRGLCVDDHVVLAVLDGQTVVALDPAGGSELWRWSRADARFDTPVTNAATAFVPSRDGFLTALDLATGRPLWTAPTDGAPVGVAADAQMVYVATASNRLVALQTATGAVAWKTTLPALPVGCPTRVDDHIIVTTHSGLVVSFGK